MRIDSWPAPLASAGSVVAWTTRPLFGLFTGQLARRRSAEAPLRARELAGALVGDSKDCAEFANG